MKYIAFITLACLIFVCFNADDVSAETLTVSCTNNGDYDSLQEAVDNVNNGGIINIEKNCYFEENVVIDKSVYIRGDTNQSTTSSPPVFDGNGTSPIIVVSDNVHIS